MRDEVSHLHDRTARLVIGLYTDDFSMIHDLTRELSMRNVTLVHYAEGDVIGDELDALIIRKGVPLPTFKGGKSTVVNMMRDPLATVDRALAAGMGRYRPGRLTIGIDPGSRPGVAFIADGLLIKAESASDTSEVRSIIRRAVRAIGPERSMIRIGRGDPANRDSIIDVLDGIGIPIEIVDERRTTRGTKFRDQNAAVRIARESSDPDEGINFKKG